ncbi:hypothetical protein KUTeg_007071, partial [Tegillarca granosa]
MMMGLSLTCISDKTAPLEPQKLQVLSVSESEVSLAWEPSNVGRTPTKYLLEKETHYSGRWALIEEINDISITNYCVKDLEPETSYRFRIKAVNEMGNSSATYCYVTTLDVPKPTSLQVLDVTSNKIKFRWSITNKDNRSVSFDVQVREIKTGNCVERNDEVYKNEFVIQGLKPDCKYALSVATKINGRSSSFADIKCRTNPKDFQPEDKRSAKKTQMDISPKDKPIISESRKRTIDSDHLNEQNKKHSDSCSYIRTKVAKSEHTSLAYTIRVLAQTPDFIHHLGYLVKEFKLDSEGDSVVQMFNTLLIPIDDYAGTWHIEDGITTLLNPEIFENNALPCDKCHDASDETFTVKTMEFKHLPTVLILQMGKFKQQNRCLRMQKQKCYRLYGVTLHYGSLAGGHYTAYVKINKTSRDCDDQWYDCSDSFVRKISSEFVLEAEDAYKKSKDIYFALKLLTPTFATLINVEQLKRNTKGVLENFILIIIFVSNDVITLMILEDKGFKSVLVRSIVFHTAKRNHSFKFHLKHNRGIENYGSPIQLITCVSHLCSIEKVNTLIQSYLFLYQRVSNCLESVIISIRSFRFCLEFPWILFFIVIKCVIDNFKFIRSKTRYSILKFNHFNSVSVIFLNIKMLVKIFSIHYFSFNRSLIFCNYFIRKIVKTKIVSIVKSPEKVNFIDFIIHSRCTIFIVILNQFLSINSVTIVFPFVF